MNTANTLDPRWAAARRVLAIRLDNLGDVLVTTPAIHAIRESLPDARITLLASPVGAQAAALDRDIDDVLVYEAPWMDPWQQLPQDSGREQAMIRTLRHGAFDGAIIFSSYHQSPLPAAYLAYLADIPLRVAASIDGPGSLLTTRHRHPDRVMHEVERGLDLVGSLGMHTQNVDLQLCVPGSARARVRSLPEVSGAYRHALEDAPSAGARRSRPLVVVHPGCSMPARTYPWKLFAEVVDLLVARLGAEVMLTGTTQERDLVQKIHARVRRESIDQVHMLAGTLSFAELCALIEMADVTVTNNTGPMHISAAVKTPVVALFALTNPPEQWGPWHVAYRQLYHDVSCRNCYRRVCPFAQECLSLVSPEQVACAAQDLISLHEGHRVPFLVGQEGGER
jgi:ADP-heptose:LPS heptosyltransferase